MSVSADDLDAIGEGDPRITFGKWWRPSSRRQLFSAAWASLKIMASAVLFDRQPFARTVRWRIVAEVLSIGFVVRKCFQCSAGKLEKASRASRSFTRHATALSYLTRRSRQRHRRQ